jgi:glycosyltransferase involved in cell wall biosynthesis
MPIPRVSVLILTCNRPHLVGRALQSIRDQNLKAEYEIIVVHDGPDRRSELVLKEWQARDPRIRYFHREKSGNIADATNFALRQAKGEYIAILDDDDYWSTPDKLAMQVRFLDSHPDYAGCGGGAIVVDQDKNELMRYLKPQSDEAIKGRALIANPMVHSTMLYRSSAAEMILGYDVTLAGFQDWDFGLRLGLTGKLYNIPDYLTYYSIWDGGSSWQQAPKNTRAAVRIVWRHRKCYSHFPTALALVFCYYAYSLLPASIRRHSYSFLSRLKKLGFSERQPPLHVPSALLRDDL